MKSWIAALAVTGLMGTGCAPMPPAPSCPASALDLPLEALFGAWEARFEGLPGTATVELARHPEYAGVRGTVRHGDAGTAQLAGDVAEGGGLELDESIDGRSISGVWHGELDPASCGKVFRGVWRHAADDRTHPFVLTRIAPSR
jgi:hypothetical protein